MSTSIHFGIYGVDKNCHDGNTWHLFYGTIKVKAPLHQSENLVELHGWKLDFGESKDTNVAYGTPTN